MYIISKTADSYNMSYTIDQQLNHLFEKGNNYGRTYLTENTRNTTKTLLYYLSENGQLVNC